MLSTDIDSYKGNISLHDLSVFIQITTNVGLVDDFKDILGFNQKAYF